jgi:hypothetical protein
MPELIIPGNNASAGAQVSSDAVKGAIGAAANNLKSFHVGKYDNYKCECGCQLFTTAVVIKKVPAVDLGEILNEDVPVPVEQIPVWVCTKCGELAPFIKNDESSMKIINKILREDKSEENTK